MPEGDAVNYDRARALFPADVLAWVQETQPKAWETLTKNHGAQAGGTLLTRLHDQLGRISDCWSRDSGVLTRRLKLLDKIQFS